MAKEQQILSKEQILYKCIDEKWPSDRSLHFAHRNKLAKLSTWGIEHKAMDEYAKQEAISFGDWLCDNGYERLMGTYSWECKFSIEDLNAIINSLSPKQYSIEQLYTLYQESIKQKT